MARAAWPHANLSTPCSATGCARRPRTATCSTPTPTWPRSSTCACASSRARWRPSWSSRSRSASTPRPQWLEPRAGGLGLLLLDGIVAVEVQVGDRTATELTGAGDLLQAPSADRRRPARARRDAGTSSCPARVAVLDAGFAERVRPWPQIALALLRRAGKRAERPRRAARHRLPAAARGPPGADAVAPRRALGQGRARRHPPLAPAHPPAARAARRGRAPVGLPRARPPGRGRARHRPRRRVAPARHRSSTTSRASPSAGTTSHPRPPRRCALRPAPDAADRVHPGPAAQRAPAGPRGVDDERAGLRRRHRRADGGDQPVARGAAHGRDPGHAGRRHLQPDARLRERRRAHAGLVRRRARAPRPLRARARGLGAQRADQRRGPLGGRSASTPRAASRSPTCSWIDRLAPKAAAVDGASGRARPTAASRRCATTRPAPWACATTWAGAGRRAWASRSSTSPAARSQPNNITETLLAPRAAARRAGADDRPRRPGPAAVAVRPHRPRDLQPRGLRRGRAAFADTLGDDERCLVKLGCKGPVVKCNVPDARLGQRDRRLPERRRHLHRRAPAPGFPDRFMPFVGARSPRDGGRARCALHLRPRAALLPRPPDAHDVRASSRSGAVPRPSCRPATRGAGDRPCPSA